METMPEGDCMKVIINSVTYSRVKVLSFAPEIDLSLSSVPINQFVITVVTSDTISIDQWAALYDDRDEIWAKYWITRAEKDSYDTWTITAKSPLYLLDYWETMPESKYVITTFENLVNSIMIGIPITFDYTIENSLKSFSIGNYFPEESPMTRLHKACFCAGAYIKTFFSDKVQFVKLSSSSVLIERNKIFGKPKINFKDIVTTVKVKYYAYDGQGEITSDGWYSLSNSDSALRDVNNVVTVENISFINQSNASGIANRMSLYYFPVRTCEIDVINNADYKPGDKIRFYKDDTSDVLTGYVKSCSFSFGLQARAVMTVEMIDDV